MALLIFPTRLIIAAAAPPGDHSALVDPTFSDANWISLNPSIPGSSGLVYAAVADGANNLYIGGSFAVVGGVIANGVAKWDGNSWSALGSGMGNGNSYTAVYALAVSGSDLYAAGEFTTATNTGGATVTVNRIAKWDGSNWTALSSGMDRTVYALAVSGSDLYAGGVFTAAGGTAASYLAKWDGSNWSALGAGPHGSVHALAVSGNDLYAGGDFIDAGDTLAFRIAKWDGSGWTALGLGMNGPVYALAVSGDDVYAGGNFTTASGSATNYVVRWNGSSWSPLASGVNGIVDALATSGSDVYAGGRFTTAGGGTAFYVAKWDGSNWTALGSGMDSDVRALAVSGNGLYAAGYFSTAGGRAASHISEWSGSSWSALGSRMGGVVALLGVSALLAASNYEIYAGGAFTTAGSSTVNGIAKWNGSSWSALSSGMDDTVRALVVLGSELYAGGDFRTAGGSATDFIASWNGSGWTALSLGMNGPVYALAVLGDELYAAGEFTTATNSGGAVTVNRIAKWDGNSWSALASGVGNGNSYTAVFALAVLGDELYAAGEFTTATNSGGVAVIVNRIARWDGNSWSALASGVGNGSFRTGVYALAVSGSDLYAGGSFSTAGGTAAANIAKWSGANWTGLGSGTDRPVYALTASGSDLYAGGGFTTAGGSRANYLAKWNGSSWTALGSGMSDSVIALAVSGTELYVGGPFTIAGGKVSPYIARAYLLTVPTLSMLRSGPEVTVSWPSVATDGFALERAGTLASPANWVTNTAPVTDDGTNKSVTVDATNGSYFFRLRRP